MVLKEKIDKKAAVKEEDISVIVHKLSLLLIEMNNIDEKNEEILLSFCKYRKITALDVQKISDNYGELKKLLLYATNRKDDIDLYIKENFNSKTIKRFINQEINSLEKLIEVVIKIKREKWLKRFIKKLETNEDFRDIAKTLKMSDVITQALFLKLLLPNIIASGLSKGEVKEIFNLLKSLALSKPNHKEFYEVFETISSFLYLFGYNKAVFDYLGCFK